MGKKKNNLDLALIDKYCLSSSPLYDVVPLKVTYTFTELDENELKDLEEFANIEGGKIERWLLVPDCISLGVLGFVIQRAFGLTPYAFNSSFLMDEEEQAKLFPTLEKALLYCGSVFDNPMETEYLDDLYDLAAIDKNFVPSIPMAMMIPPAVTYEKAQETVKKETEKIRKKGVEIDGTVYRLDGVGGALSALYEKTPTKDFDWCDELIKTLELKDVLIPQGKKRPDFSKRFNGQRSTTQKGRKKGQPFCYRLYMHSFFENDPAFVFEVERPSSIEPLVEEGYVTLEDYLDSIRFVSREIKADCIYKKGYNLFSYDEDSYYNFIMMLHSPMRDTVESDAVAAGWEEPNLDLKKIFR